MNTKVCGKCKEVLPVDKFHKNKHKPDGLAYQCKECRKTEARLPGRIEYSRKYAEENKERRYEQYKDWAKANPDKKRVSNSRRRAMIKGSEQVGFIPELSVIVEWYGKGCLFPGCDREDATLDHVIPLDLGGAHALFNIQPLCGHHNYSKKNSVADYRGGRILIALMA